MKIKVSISRTESRFHDFEIEMPDDMNPAEAKANAQDAAVEMACDFDWHDAKSTSADYEVEGIEVEA